MPWYIKIVILLLNEHGKERSRMDQAYGDQVYRKTLWRPKHAGQLAVSGRSLPVDEAAADHESHCLIPETPDKKLRTRTKISQAVRLIL